MTTFTNLRNFFQIKASLSPLHFFLSGFCHIHYRMNNSSLITIALAIFISLSLPHAQTQYLCYNTDFSLNYLKSKPCSLEFFVPASGTSFQFLSKLSLQLYGDLILKLVKESQKQNSGNLIQTEGYFYKHMACISKFHRS